MVVEDSEVGEVESTLQEQRNHPFSTLGRQSSIYSLTLDEFQHTLCEGGKNFGSMNMDEFLASIWNAEENQATNNNNNGGNEQVSRHVNTISKGVLSKQPSLCRQGSLALPTLPRQGSLSLPAPLCRKTVDEVWSEIHRVKHGQGQSINSSVQNTENSTSTRQPTFGEMTLEDFLVKAGVVQEPIVTTPPQNQQQIGLHQGLSFVPRPIMAIGGSTYQTMPAAAAAPPPSTSVCYNAAAGGYGVVSPISPVSPEGRCTNQVGNPAFEMDMCELRGRKRIIDGPIEKVVERRQRRMIKNRESAARSRARRQAYTVELEAELNQLKQQNDHLKQALVELETKRKQQYYEDWKMRTQTKAQKAKEKLRTIRRNLSCPL